MAPITRGLLAGQPTFYDSGAMPEIAGISKNGNRELPVGFAVSLQGVWRIIAGTTAQVL